MKFLLALGLSAGPCLAGPSVSDVPVHLAMARELAQNIKPEDNRYVLGGRFISFPGDRFSDRYAAKSDCTGFLLALFERAKYPTEGQMEFLHAGPKRKRLVAEDFVLSIEQEKGFKRIARVEDARLGDVLAHAMLNRQDQLETGTTGHVLLIDSVPKPIMARRPVVEGTRQFEVAIIDSNFEYAGADDSRLAGRSSALTGVGRATIRLYADSEGGLAGWARTFPNATRFFSYTPKFPSDTKLRKAAIGRPNAIVQDR